MNRQQLNDVGRYGLILVLLVATVAGCDGASDTEITAANPYAPGEVEIIIDSMGVPHIYGGTDADVLWLWLPTGQRSDVPVGDVSATSAGAFGGDSG